MGAVAGLALGDPATSPAFEGLIPHALVQFLNLAALAIAGGWLLVTGRDDRRAVHLGTFFLLLASSFANRWLGALIEILPRLPGALVLVLRSMQVDSFFPYFFWRFAQEFPRTSHSFRVKRLLRRGAQLALLLGIVLFVKELLRLGATLGVAGGAGGLGEILHDKPSYEHYGPLWLATIAALAVLLRNARAAAGAERRRARLFAVGLAVALVPLGAHIALGQIDALKRFVEPTESSVQAILVLFLFFSLSFVTAYSVLVHHVLDVKLLARRAIQYALARGSALALIALPLATLLGYFVLRSEQRIDDLVAEKGIWLLLLAALGAAALAYRKPLLEAIDRRFYREQYDAARILTVLVHDLRAASDAHEIADLTCRELDRALHLEGATLLVADPRSGNFTEPRTRGRRLDASSALARLVADGVEPLDTELEGRPGPATRLPEEDRRWLGEHGARLMVPIPASDGTLLGIIVLGAKRSGLPFLAEDRLLLRDVANSAALGLELSRIRAEAAQPRAAREGDGGAAAAVATPPSAENARECPNPNCGRVFLSYTVFCSHCSRRLEQAHIPYVLPPNRFRFERRIGAGGMGLVYRAWDLSLGRPVAIKTLRKVSPDHALRLRREARTAAAVVDPHLAGIYGVDTWQGTPMLILELLEGGTLGKRIEAGVQAPLDTVDLGIAMAGALERLHAHDILHRDVKPNNIGFTRDGVPKLMDFGIARMVLDSRTEPTTSPPSGSLDILEMDDDQVATWVWGAPGDGDPKTRAGQLVGTLAYLAPEALEGSAASPSFDLWGLAVVLYECLIGRKLFRGEEIKQVMARIVMGRVPELTDVREDAPEPLARFFRTALHRDPERRPQSAAALRRQLLEVRAELAAGAA